MSDAVLFAIIFIGFFILRIIAATVVFLLILPTGDRCPNCDEITLRIQSRGWNTLLPWFRTSWCLRCGWEGLLRQNKQLSPGVPEIVSSKGRSTPRAS